MFESLKPMWQFGQGNSCLIGAMRGVEGDRRVGLWEEGESHEVPAHQVKLHSND